MKKFFGVILSIALIIFSGVMLTGCGDDNLILVVGVDFYQEEVYASVNEEINLSHKVYPSNATNLKVTYWSSNDSVASVDENGKVVVKDNGEAIIAVRTIDGGFEDYCRIITNIDPDEIVWDTDDGRIIPVNESGVNYSGKATVAVDQNIRLDIKYLIDGMEDPAVTNKNIKFTSSNPDNIEVINEKEGILRAIDSNVRSEENIPYSDITATLQTLKGELKLVCRVEVNEYSSVENLYVKTSIGNEDVLINRDGSDQIILDASDNVGVELHSYLFDDSKIKKSDYDMTVFSSNPNIFVVSAIQSVENTHYFTIKSIAEGSASLFIETTCYDESGQQIGAVINIIVQAAVADIEVSASSRYESATEKEVTLVCGQTEHEHTDACYEDNDKNKELICEKIEHQHSTDCLDTVKVLICTEEHEHTEECYADGTKEIRTEMVILSGTASTFNLTLTYKDAKGQVIENAQRKIYFAFTNGNEIPEKGEIIDGVYYNSCKDYVTYYGNNNFKVNAVPENINTKFYIKGFVARENNADVTLEENRVYFYYTFYIRNELEGLFVSVTESVPGSSAGTTEKPSSGITEVNILLNHTKSLYAYSYSSDVFSDAEPVNVTFNTENCDGIVTITRDENNSNKYNILATNQGEGSVTFIASDGVNEYKVILVIHVVR